MTWLLLAFATVRAWLRDTLTAPVHRCGDPDCTEDHR